VREDKDLRGSCPDYRFEVRKKITVNERNNIIFFCVHQTKICGNHAENAGKCGHYAQIMSFLRQKDLENIRIKRGKLRG